MGVVVRFGLVLLAGLAIGVGGAVYFLDRYNGDDDTDESGLAATMVPTRPPVVATAIPASPTSTPAPDLNGAILTTGELGSSWREAQPAEIAQDLGGLLAGLCDNRDPDVPVPISVATSVFESAEAGTTVLLHQAALLNGDEARSAVRRLKTASRACDRWVVEALGEPDRLYSLLAREDPGLGDEATEFQIADFGGIIGMVREVLVVRYGDVLVYAMYSGDSLQGFDSAESARVLRLAARTSRDALAATTGVP